MPLSPHQSTEEPWRDQYEQTSDATFEVTTRLQTFTTQLACQFELSKDCRQLGPTAHKISVIRTHDFGNQRVPTEHRPVKFGLNARIAFKTLHRGTWLIVIG